MASYGYGNGLTRRRRSSSTVSRGGGMHHHHHRSVTHRESHHVGHNGVPHHTVKHTLHHSVAHHHSRKGHSVVHTVSRHHTVKHHHGGQHDFDGASMGVMRAMGRAAGDYGYGRRASVGAESMHPRHIHRRGYL